MVKKGKAKYLGTRELKIVRSSQAACSKSMLSSLIRVRMLQGSSHRNVGALIVAVSVARWRLKTVGAEQEIFNKRVINSLVSKVDEGTQARWYIHFTKDPQKHKEDVFIEWLNLQEAGGKYGNARG